MKFISKKSISYFFLFIVLILISYYLINNYESLKSVRWWENPGFLSFHIMLLVLTFVLFVTAWQRLLKTIGIHEGLKVAGYTWLVSNIGKYVPGKILMVAGRIALLNNIGVRPATAAAVVIWEHIIVILATMPFSLFILLNYSGYYSLKIIISVMFVLFSIILIALNPSIVGKMINYFLNLFKRPPLEYILQRKAVMYFFIFYLITWIVYGLSGVTLAYVFGFEDKIPLFLLFNVFIFSWLMGFVSIITPGGLGVREGIMILMISPYVPMNELIVFTLFARITWTITELFGVLVGIKIGNKLYV